MSIFVLIHGAWHGAWCWEKVVPLLEQAGHTVIAPDLPGHGDDPTPIPEVTLDAYVARIKEVVDAQNEPVILVGHSMGGIPISQAAENFPDKIRTLIHLTAFMLQDGEFLFKIAGADAEAIVVPNAIVNETEGYLVIRDEAIRDCFYADCSEEDVAWAKSRLVRQALQPFVAPVKLSPENFGRVPRYYISCLQDRAISPTSQRGMYTALPPQKVLELATSHSPFISAPAQLAELLLAIQAGQV